MYSVDKKALEEKQKAIEIDIHPISKWKRVLLYLGDLMVAFVTSVILMTIVIVPLSSLVVKNDTNKAKIAQMICNDILYNKELLFYRSENDNLFPKNDFQSNLIYTFNRFLAYYTFLDEEESLNLDYPEYKHLDVNEVVRHYYVDIVQDEATYIDLFFGHERAYNYFEYSMENHGQKGIPFKLKDDIINEIKPFFDPNDRLGKLGRKYYTNLSELYAALFGVVIRDIKDRDLKASLKYEEVTKEYSFIEQQKIIDDAAFKSNLHISISAIISYLLIWAILYVIYPLINKSRHTIVMSIMRVDRLGMNNLMPLSKGETVMTGVYAIVFNLPYLMFLSLSYFSFILSLNVPILPFLSIISLIPVMIGLFTITFNGFNRSFVDLLSRTVIVASEEVDSIIKAKETLQEVQTSERRRQLENAQ